MTNQISPAGVIIRQTVAKVRGWATSAVLPFTELTSASNSVCRDHTQSPRSEIPQPA